MTKSFQRRLVIDTAIACFATCVAAPPAASAQTGSRAQLTTTGATAGLHYGVPLKWSMALGFVLPSAYKDWQPFVAAEPGIGGWRASVGALKMTNELGGGYVARTTVLRTNKKAWRAPGQATYVGPEFQFMPLFAIGARVGGFVRVGGSGGQRGLLTADVSVMF